MSKTAMGNSDTPVVIASGSNTSGEIALKGYTPIGIYTDATMTGTSISFKASNVSGGPYEVVGDGAGSVFSVPLTAGQYIPITNAAVLAGVNFLLIVSNATESAARNLTLMGTA